jgi:hypothetical protein
MRNRAAESDFWTSRKARVKAEQQAEEQATRAKFEAAEQTALDQKSDAELLEEFGLPDPDTLIAGDDIKGFMSKAVPDRLRRRALRQLWKLNPVLANVDGLVDYGQDFTDSAMVIENMATTYQVGKGMLAHVQEMARQAEAKLALQAEEAPDAPDAPGEAVTEEDAMEAPEILAQTGPAADVEIAAVSHTDLEPEDPQTLPSPRRMRFHYGQNQTTGASA